jgi:GNAT superfamily N-acetyltransferase
MEISVGVCRLDEFAGLIELLDNEFVFAKGRQLSLARRFPQVFCAANLDNIYVARSENLICASVAVKHFDWIAQGLVWRGAIVGTVYTMPQFRGRGIASLVMSHAQDILKKKGVDFAVLFTTIPKFYERLGWLNEDTGVFSETFFLPPSKIGNPIRPCSLTSERIQWIDSLRSIWEPERVRRSEVDYRALPLPSNSVDVFIVDEVNGFCGYALVGRVEETGYVYELVGHPSSFNRLWSSFANCYCRTFINDRWESPTTKWLSESQGIMWKQNHLAMWQRFSEKLENMVMGQWYIPYLDRI